MKITVDLQKFLIKLKAFNPDVDFTGVKAYLLDLALEQKEEEEILPTTLPAKAAYVPDSIKENLSLLSQPINPQEFLEENSSVIEASGSEVNEGITRENRKPRKVVVSNSSGKASSLERAARRQDLSQFSEMNSKELIEKLFIPKGSKKNGNQFTDIGSDSAPSKGDDLEIG